MSLFGFKKHLICIYGKQKKELRRKSSYYQRVRDKARARLGNCCVQCGFSDWRALQVDHINGNGTLHNSNGQNVKKFLEIIRMEFPNRKYQLLCANCNWIKRFTNNEHRKQEKT